MRRIWPAKNSQWLLPVLSGIFIGTSYIPFPPWASLFCFVPLWLFWQQQDKLKNRAVKRRTDQLYLYLDRFQLGDLYLA